jgi:hypothetical protein
MSIVKIFTPENRLADIVGESDDPTVASLVRDAENRVFGLRDQIRRHVAEQHAVLARLAHAPEEEIFADCHKIAAAARGISDVAGAADMEAVGEAARGIFALINALGCKGVWHTDALKLHVTALALLNSDTPPSRGDAVQILKKLKAMREWVGATD